ncbi:hypothetical protein HYW83_06220 [Candidatus Peregrinibacteria bacterium]|nr:hypothetical protein [Candidatus Peregrinibacteria bacterium]
MNFSRYKKWIFGIGIWVIVLAVAGFFYWKSSAIKLPWQPTSQGIFFEELLPPDVSFAMSFNPTDDAQRQSFEKLWATILQDKKDVILPFIATNFAKSSQTPLPLADLLTLFGNNLQFTLALGSGSSIKTPDAFFLFRTEDPLKARAIFQRVKQADDQLLRDTPDAFAFSRGKAAKAHIGLIGDTGFFALTSKEKTQQLIAHFEKRNSFFRMASLANSKKFRSAAKFLEGAMSGYIFFFPGVTGKGIEASVVRYVAQENGFSFDGITLSGTGKDSDILRSKVFQPFVPSLSAKIPLSKALLFEEVGNAGSLLLSQLDALRTDFKKWTDFDFATDILPFLDKDAVLAVEDTGRILPAVSVWLDASVPGASEKAKTAFEKLDAKVKSWVTLGNIALPANEAGQNKPVFNMQPLAAPFTGSKVILCLDCVSKKLINVPLLFELIRDPLEISYGMTSDNILFVSTLPNFEKTFSDTAKAEDHPLFKRAQSLEPKPGNTVFIDGEVIGASIERIINLARSNKKFSESEEQSYALLKKHFSPIKSFIQTSQGDGKSMFGKAFLEIRGSSTQQ